MDLLNLTKEESKNLLDLRKQKVVELNLNKPSLTNHKARVSVVLDYSGSMRTYYRNGTVQAIIERVFPIALNFDDNGAMDVWIFHDGFRRLPEMREDNYYGYIQREIMDKGYHMGGTNYAPVIRDVMEKYLVEEPESTSEYVLFITDGDNFDKHKTTEAIVDSANYPIFWQFVGIGGKEDDFPYLQKLDDMGGRTVDNADFFSVSNVSDMYSHDAIYQFLLNEYSGWLVNPIVTNQITNNYRYNQQQSKTEKRFFGLF